MFELVLTFVLATSPPERPMFEQHVVQYASQAACRSAQSWWMANPDAELPGMDPANELLIGPSCRAVRPAIG